MHVKLIAEIGQAHNGSIQKAHDYIDALAKTDIESIVDSNATPRLAVNALGDDAC